MRQKKYFSKFKETLTPLPNLVEGQLESFKWLLEKGLADVFSEFSSIQDFTGKKFELDFTGFELQKPKHDEFYAKENKINYEAPLKVMVKLKNKILGTEKEQEVFMADFPMMTEHGTFVINGIERLIVPQLARSYGVFFTANELKGKSYYGAKIIPARGPWIEIETEADGAMFVKIDRKRKFPVSSLLRIFGADTDTEIFDLFKTSRYAKPHLEATFAKDHAKTTEESYVEIYRKLRDGDLATPDNAKEHISSLFSAERYEFSRVGRFRFNQRFGKPMTEEALSQMALTLDDLVTSIIHMIELNHNPHAAIDDIDHLGSRRVRFVGEMLQQKVRIGMTQIKRNIQNRMSTIDSDANMPINFISPRPLQARVR